MKAQQFRLDGAYRLSIDTMTANDRSNVVLVFGSRRQLLENNWFSLVSKMYPKAAILSSSTAGEIFESDVLDDSLTVTALEFEHTPIVAQVVNIKDYKNAMEAGVALGKKIDRKKLSLLLLISDGHIVKADDLLKGLYKEIPNSVSVVGGLAGDGNRFQMTLVGLNNLPEEGNVAAVAFYGDQIKASSAAFSGWEPFGPVRTITKADGNKLFDIDNKSILQLYKDYLGERSRELPASAMLFPLFVITQSEANQIIRTPIAFDEQEQSMTFAGDIPIGAKVQLMKYNHTKLVDSASAAAEYALSQQQAGAPQLSILISCAGRKLALGPRTVEEVESVRSIFGKKTIITGFYSYGEICPPNGSTISEVNNQTMAILSINETEKPLNNMLQRQVKKYFGAVENLSPEVRAFCESINEVYEHYEGDLELNNRAFDISSRELIEANDKMQFVSVKQQEVLDRLRNSFISLKGNSTLNIQQTADLNNIESLLQLISNEIEIQKSHETDLKNAIAEAERANHFKSLYFANVSHEIRTQLNAITGFTNILAKDLSNEEAGEFLSIIKSSGELLLYLLNDIIDIAKIEEGKIPIEKAPFRFRKTVYDALSPFKYKSHDKGLDFSIDFDEAVPENVIGDSHRFSQIVINLVNNAIKFTSKGSIKIKFIKVEDAKAEPGNVVIKCTVNDTGIGVADDVKEKLFQSFTQADSSISRRFGGSGLGLAISKHLANLMGGDIGISKTKPQSEGSEFYFTVTLEVQKNAPEFQVPTISDGTKHNNKFEKSISILVADDDIINQRLMKKVLEDMNCHVTIASDGEQALRQLLDKPFDAVLMDVEMPKLNGYQATEVIRQQLRNQVPVIGLTAHADEANRGKGISSGMNDFMVKPINEDLIYNMLNKYVHKN